MKFAKSMTTKALKYHNGKPKLEARWYLLVGDERKCKKRKQKCTNGGLQLLETRAPVSF